MNIGFDAKRAFHNNTGLGNYSRTLVSGLAQFYHGHQYYLFNPKHSRQFPKPSFDNVHEVLPANWLSKTFSSAWRSSWVKNDLKRLHIDLYHGLSHEIPNGIQSTGMKSVVTIHDLIFERYPEQFSKIDIQIYRHKFKYACTYADRVIAISEQTRQDIIDFYQTDPGKIDVCYQSCNPAFANTYNEEKKETYRKKYHLPAAFFLCVGSIIERKNLLNICKAYLYYKDAPPLVVIGQGKAYKNKVKAFIDNHQLTDKVIFLSEREEASKDFRSPDALAAIYQMAIAMIYPSFFEGFGIPVLEALWSRLPVITSNVSCLPETAGDAAFYVDPSSPEDIAKAMRTIYEDKELREHMKEKGWLHAQQFTLDKCAGSVMNVYQKLMYGSF